MLSYTEQRIWFLWKAGLCNRKWTYLFYGRSGLWLCRVGAPSSFRSVLWYSVEHLCLFIKTLNRLIVQGSSMSIQSHALNAKYSPTAKNTTPIWSNKKHRLCGISWFGYLVINEHVSLIRFENDILYCHR